MNLVDEAEMRPTALNQADDEAGIPSLVGGNGIDQRALRQAPGDVHSGFGLEQILNRHVRCGENPPVVARRELFASDIMPHFA
jgi:hypothetical protein